MLQGNQVFAAVQKLWLCADLELRVRYFYKEFDDEYTNISYRHDIFLSKKEVLE